MRGYSQWVCFVKFRQNTSVCQAFALLDQLIGGAFKIPGRMTGLVLHQTLRTKIPFALVVKVTLIVEDT